MALSPGIPTSFVPKQPAPQTRRPSGGHNLFLVAAVFIFGLSIIAAIGTFAYDRYLSHALEVKAAELADAQRQVNEEQVEEFVRLRDRLTYGRDLLDSHVALSQVFDVLEAQTLLSVRFSSLDLTVADDKTAQIEIEGVARNFNALAAQSNAFAAEKGIRRAIFSGIVVNDNNTVSFRLTADLDSRLLISEAVDTPPADLPAAPAVVPTPAPTSTTPGAPTI
ncbi:MAG TPA: hypothetical protein VJA87_01740 [Candidatus Paceibacterota bacterium]